ncbi:Microtubule-associated protein RP/EB family member 1 [Toxocara canis]|uniref:Microtubule-associated protein RP/EB family member 1 n=1 Tax=Toxocara canis TaxID=6265 RepID=A0A0B2VNX6_TOXCA|nr:Microtubule-associated protein RP/EB family member 1 [Toxocara canis]
MVHNVFATSASADNCSRHDLLAFVNDCLQANFTRIEEMSTGAAYCQLTDFLFRGSIQLRKVKWNSKNELDWIANWRLLQTAWKELEVEKAVPVERLLKGKFQDNFEFLQWFKKFFDANCTANPYDPIAARNGEPLPASAASGSTKASTSRMMTKRVNAGNGAHSATNMPAPRSQPMLRSATKPIVGSSTALQMERERCKELQVQLEEAANALTAIEKERNFYFSKLQKVEEYCQNAGETANVPCEAILQILYEIEEGFAVPNLDEGIGQDEAASAETAKQEDPKTNGDTMAELETDITRCRLNDSETF